MSKAVSVVTTLTVSDPATFTTVLHSLYGPVHKGLRSQLFALQMQIGAADADDRQQRADIHVFADNLHRHLQSHAGHEERWIDPVLIEHAPEVGEVLEAQHEAFEPILNSILDLAVALAGTDEPDEARHILDVLHLDTSRFIGAYLTHMDIEERIAMPMLERTLGTEGVMELHENLLGSVTPEVMAQMQAFMLPAMNPHERISMLAGIRAGAPAEVYEGTLRLAGSVLEPAEMRSLEAALLATGS